MRLFTALLCAFLLAGCGYKPVSAYAKKALGSSVYVTVETSRSDPENTVIIKDALLEMLVTRFNTRLAPSKQNADSSLAVAIESIEFLPLEYDKNGYVVLYRVTVALNGKLTSGESTKELRSTGSYDFPIEPNTTISESKRFDAIKNGAAKSIERLISQISIFGALK